MSDHTRFLLATLTGGFAGSLVEWLFSGDIWLPLYRRYPQTWRNKLTDPGYSETPGIIAATGLAFVSAAAFMFLLELARAHGYGHDTLVALLVWITVPLPLLLVQSRFMKYPPELALVHAAGWLAKLVVFALAAALFRI